MSSLFWYVYAYVIRIRLYMYWARENCSWLFLFPYFLLQLPSVASFHFFFSLVLYSNIYFIQFIGHMSALARTHTHIHYSDCCLYGSAILSHSWWSKISISCSIETVPFNTHRLQKLYVQIVHTNTHTEIFIPLFFATFFSRFTFACKQRI